ncbi:type II toxin-antitoxin system HicA family toxin [Pasteurellaceae bacterium USgator11]|nr:type II toxin-antitoxin system HicA family toxin [Pasteurellaceae bacterium USgator41]TNG93936.1 type II toxin-antitoxin system HicA family toxin [Pasteurellaceae bacterium UScroc12]TNG97916.1 type II toxin-antitoxin system HicA family toxin [Pasteurellaceae bacterium UScroc31]TNH02040.1 type II toxin-antitoxin system HicA family toxin [Pasteurellaceae bacterium USgator11]
MSKLDKLKKKLYKEPAPKDFAWDELKTLLLKLGFIEEQGSGSRVKFYHPELDYPINLHKPHPGNILKEYILKRIKETLDDLGV